MSEGDATEPIESPAERRRLPYAHPLAHYVATFGRSVRTLKWLIARGREANPPELPPLDDAPRMKDWWARNMKQRVPDDLVKLATVQAPAANSPPSPAPSDASIGPLFSAAPTPSSSPSPQSTADVGYSAALQRVREAEASTGRLYNLLIARAAEASCTPDDRAKLLAEAEGVRRTWDDQLNRLRPMEKDAASILTEAGRVWSVDEVQAAMSLVHFVLRESVYNLLRRVRPKLGDKPPAEQDRLWFGEVEAMFAALRENKFTAPVTLPPDVVT